jgi:hypothetical protein
MLDVISRVRGLPHRLARRRASLTMQRLGSDLGALRRDLDGVWTHVLQGFLAKEARRRASSTAEALPRLRRRPRPNPAAVSAPAVAAAALAAVAGLMLWDERRRAAMRRRLQEVAGSVSSGVSSGLSRVDPRTLTGARRE